MATWFEQQTDLAKLQFETFPANRRILVISDIHGRPDYLKGLLSKVSYTQDDILVLLGDLAEKGPDNLGTLRYIMRLCEADRVFPVCGNCEAIWDYLLLPENGEMLRDYLKFRPASLVGHMARELGITVDSETDMTSFIRVIRENYSGELAFLRSLPQILDTEDLTFVHAGLSEGPLEKQRKYDVMTKPAFYESGLSFRKYCITGHWPTCLYSTVRQCCNPIIDRGRRIVSIDGANVLKRDGQLNALIIDRSGAEPEFSFVSFDDLPAATALDPQEAAVQSHNIPWTDNEVELLEDGEETVLIRQKSTGITMRGLKSYLYEEKGILRTEDMTDDRLPVAAGERVSVVERTADGAFIKKDGYSGWYYGRLD